MLYFSYIDNFDSLIIIALSALSEGIRSEYEERCKLYKERVYGKFFNPTEPSTSNFNLQLKR